MEIALCFFGLTRSLKHNYKYIEKNIINPLTENNYQVYIYIHTYKLNAITNKRSGESKTPLSSTEWSLLKPNKYIIENQNNFDKSMDLSSFTTDNSIKNVVRQAHSLEKVTELWENDNDRDFKAIFYIRPDTFIVKKFDVSILKNVKQNELYINTKIKPYPNDRFAFGGKNAMSHYGHRFKKTIESLKDQNLGYGENNLMNNIKNHIHNKEIVIKHTNVRSIRKRANHTIPKFEQRLFKESFHQPPGEETKRNDVIIFIILIIIIIIIFITIFTILL